MAEMRESLVPVPKTEPGFLIQEGKNYKENNEKDWSQQSTICQIQEKQIKFLKLWDKQLIERQAGN
jgi:hypothetical protein